MQPSGKFVIRVYGIIKNKNGEILLTDEFQLGMRMTKFPGGGLEYGEGLQDCLRREFREECNGQEIKNIHHFYTTDFFQKAQFYPEHQLISIYYIAELEDPVRISFAQQPFNFAEEKDGNQSFRWVKTDQLDEDTLTFPIDRFVAKRLKEYLKNR